MPGQKAIFQAIGTRWVINIESSITNTEWARLMTQIHERIAVFDKTYSRFRPDSLVAQMAVQAGRYELPPDGYAMLELYDQLYVASEGKVTPLIGATMEAAGYDASYSLRRRSDIPQPPRWDEVIAYDTSSITLRQPALLDFGAAGKGYLVDILAAIVQHHAADYTINAGGDICHRSAAGSVLEIGLENPRDTTEAIGIARISNQSIAASSGSKRQWAGQHHIIDPVERDSPPDILATWAVADNTMTADGLATALFFAEPAVLRTRFDFSYAVLHADMGLTQARDFPATVFKAP